MSKQNLCMGCMNPKEGNPCPFCGFDTMEPYNTDYLKPNTVLDSRYIVGELKKYNGEGATYLGFDKEKSRTVWIREYFPKNISQRNKETGEVIPVTGSGAQYKALLSDFVELCNAIRRLSVSDPVVPAENMVGDNNTIYVIYKNLNVITLEEYLIAKGGKLSCEDTCELLIPLLNAVDNIHMQGIIHRGLSPYTVLVDSKEKIYIDGFSLSAARTGGSELKAEFFNGYSAPEQYISTGWQGTWTDVYAVATIFYRTVSGIVPPKSTRIDSQHPLKPLKELVPGVPEKISDAVEHAMKILAQQRTQTVVAFLSELLADENGEESTAVFDPSRSIPTSIPTEASFDFKAEDSGEQAHTEEISSPQGFDEFKRDFRNSQKKPVPQAPPNYPESRPSRIERQPEELTEELPPERQGSKAAFLMILIAVVVVGGILAIVISGKLNLNSKTEKPEDTTSILEQEESSEQQEESQEETPKDSVVPNFIGRQLSLVEYNQDYKDLYTFTVKEEYDDRWDKGIITDQSVKEGSSVPLKTTIVLTVSKGAQVVKMPDLVGKELEQAMQELARTVQPMQMTIEDLDVAEPIKKIDDTEPEGTVLSTIPLPGQEFNPNKTKIQITVAQPSTVGESTRVEDAQSESTPSSEESKLPVASRPDRPKGDDEVDSNPHLPSR